MADYSKDLAARLFSRGPNKGYCAICRVYGPLTADHVPPKSCGNVNDTVLMSIYGKSIDGNQKWPVYQGGLRFKTLCGHCNNSVLGSEYDPALRDVVNQITTYVKLAASSLLSLPRMRLFDFQPSMLLRAVTGHLLAANAIQDVESNDPGAPLDTALREYVLIPTRCLPEWPNAVGCSNDRCRINHE